MPFKSSKLDSPSYGQSFLRQNNNTTSNTMATIMKEIESEKIQQLQQIQLQKQNSQQQSYIQTCIDKTKALCVDYSKKKYLLPSDIKQLLLHISAVKKLDPTNISQNLNFIKIVWNSNKLDKLFVAVPNKDNTFDRLESALLEIESVGRTQYCVLYWSDTNIGHQIFGMPNTTNGLNSATRYVEVTKEFTKKSTGEVNKLICYEAL